MFYQSITRFPFIQLIIAFGYYVDWSRIKPEVGKDAAIELVSYVSGGYIREHAASEPADVIMSKLKLYLSLLKKAIYNEGDLDLIVNAKLF
ncbi:MAG: hypothetical protein LBS84_09245 [Clostridiales bacterium]|nr:hypothetical protein [Clostridiales bacterium]